MTADPLSAETRPAMDTPDDALAFVRGVAAGMREKGLNRSANLLDECRELLTRTLEQVTRERDEAVKRAEAREVLAHKGVKWRHRAEALERQLAEQAAEIERLRERASKEPLGVDISDYSDEFCAGFLAGQENALDAALASPSSERGAAYSRPTGGWAQQGRHLGVRGDE